ncbi:MAG: membrane protein insertion efficiency factor YidD [Gemmataceae bacterium]|nr:membrane protein insertion efficiency factor YidD [Gemmataceae bacterium]
MLQAGLTWARRVVSFGLILPVRFYQAVLSPLLPSVCKFEPSCSEYFIQAVRKHGPIRGACRGAWRICRCNPWNAGGIDPP